MSLRLPIFPLPLVLFPGTPQLLHIFEPRYRQMLDDCMAADRRFGISWAESENGEDPEPAPGSIGCIAYVQAHTKLPDGRSNILTEGDDRYVLDRYIETDRPYRVAEIEILRDEAATGDLTTLRDHVVESFQHVAAALSALSDKVAVPTKLSDDPARVSFQIAAELDLAPRIKQDILTMRSAQRRLEVLDRMLHAAMEEIRPRAEVHVRARKNGKGGPNAAIVRSE